MKIVPLIHGILDYATVLFLSFAPVLFGMQNLASTFTYALACIHLLLTLFTNFSAGAFKIVPFRVHGMIEIAVALILFGVAFWFRSSGDRFAFYFYIVFSIILFAVWALSDYKQQDREVFSKN